MENPIEQYRRFVKNQIQKSFDNELEKAHQDGDMHSNGKWVWVSSANGGKGDWRVKGGRTHNNAGASTTVPELKEAAQAESKKRDESDVKIVSERSNIALKSLDDFIGEDEGKEFGLATVRLQLVGIQKNLKNGELDRVSKRVEIALEGLKNYTDKNEGSEYELAVVRNQLSGIKKILTKKNDNTTPSPRKAGASSDIERMTTAGVRNAILGLNNIGTNVKDKGDHFLIEFDHNDFTTNKLPSPQVHKIISLLENMGASCVIGKDNIKAYKKVDKQQSDKQNKIAQQVGFKDYQAMKEFQEYSTKKSLLKKRIMQTKAKEADRKQMEAEVAEYENKHNIKH